MNVCDSKKNSFLQNGLEPRLMGGVGLGEGACLGVDVAKILVTITHTHKHDNKIQFFLDDDDIASIIHDFCGACHFLSGLPMAI